jgi:cellulose synthase/poly-beta-1,6-N-acetylglucosamine synthase-like glycosyltransferase
MLTFLFYLKVALAYLIWLYCLHQYYLFLVFLRVKKEKTGEPIKASLYTEKICVQLPIYNEGKIVEQLFRYIGKLDYPRHLLEIQVLDDSTDESQDLVKRLSLELEQARFQVKYLNRENRIDFKAGALREGMAQSTADFFCIFDADFRPSADFLKKTLIYFEDAKVGFVQTRWDFYNRHHSVLTEVQAMALDHHFWVEQNGRLASGFAINFNGTAGVWRKTCILDAGNWEGDTLTEDLDLSLRAYFKDWKVVYRPDITVPSELPDHLAAVKSQQYRWNKGGAQNFIKFFGKILRAKISVFKKLNIAVHLLNSSVFLWVSLYALASLVLVLYDFQTENQKWYVWPLEVLKLNYIFLFISFYVVNKLSDTGHNFFRFLRTFLFFMPYVMGIAWHNARAVLSAYTGRQSAFVRTAKAGKKQATGLSSFGVFPEISLLLLFSFAAYKVFLQAGFLQAGYFFTIALGLGLMIFYSFRKS